MQPTFTEIMSQLQKAISPLQGFKTPAAGRTPAIGLPVLEAAFPNAVFPTGAMHEFYSLNEEDLSATSGFMAVLLGKLMQNNGACIWIGSATTLFPPALNFFGIEPHRMIFINPKKQKDILWCLEEALKCEPLAAVVGELKEIDFTASRRLQLAVEKSSVTGFILRHQPRQLNTIAAVTRWKITPLPSQLEDGMPGMGFSRWQVALQKVRNGKPGVWDIEWCQNKLQLIQEEVPAITQTPIRKIG